MGRFDFSWSPLLRIQTHMPDTTTNAMKEAFDRLLPALRAIPADQVKKPKVDLTIAGGRVLAALPRFNKYAADLKALPHTSAQLIDELGDRALAMLWAYSSYRGVPQEPSSLPALFDRGSELRKRLLAAADFLVADGKLPASFVAEVREGSGYADLARDLLALGGLFESRERTAQLDAIAPKALVDEGLEVAGRMAVAVGARGQAGAAEEPEVVQMRDRTYTYFSEAFDEARTGLAYLRAKQGDADEILPSVFAGRRTATREEVPAPAPAPAPTPTDSLAANGSAQNGVVQVPDGTEPGGPFGPPV
jgi:hypothetical protein